jgi:hypothetical protein
LPQFDIGVINNQNVILVFLLGLDVFDVGSEAGGVCFLEFGWIKFVLISFQKEVVGRYYLRDRAEFAGKRGFARSGNSAHDVDVHIVSGQMCDFFTKQEIDAVLVNLVSADFRK